MYICERVSWYAVSSAIKQVIAICSYLQSFSIQYHHFFYKHQLLSQFLFLFFFNVVKLIFSLLVHILIISSFQGRNHLHFDLCIFVNFVEIRNKIL